MDIGWSRVCGVCVIALAWSLGVGLFLEYRACSSQGKIETGKTTPQIYITQVSVKDRIVQGRVDNLPGKPSGFRVVTYVRSDVYYVHPRAGALARIDNNGVWQQSLVPRGQEQELAALLVAADFTPPPQVPSLDELKGVLAQTSIFYVSEFKGKSLPKPRVLEFGGVKWRVRRGYGGPGPNHFNDENVDVKDGKLILRLHHANGQHQCSEVFTQPLGFGEYRWVFSGNLMSEHAVLGLFLYGRNDTEEIDFEYSRWGLRHNDQGQFVLHPLGKEKNRLYRFAMPKAEMWTVSLLWKEGLVQGRFWAGKDMTAKPLAEWSFRGAQVPSRETNLKVHMNLWAYQNPPKPIAQEAIVIHSFQFIPDSKATRTK
jgi:hypothetical protein